MPLFPTPTRPDHQDPREQELRESVVIYLPNRLEAEAAPLEAALTEVCHSTHLGIPGSTEQEGPDAALYFYAPAAEPLFAALKPTLLTHPDAANARILLATGFNTTREYRKFLLHPK